VRESVAGLSVPPATSGARPRPLDVVVVDDDRDTREMMIVVLETQGWLVRAFATLEEARTATTAQRPDVVVTDLSVDEQLGGSLLARWLRAEERTRDVGLILLSGHAVGPEISGEFDEYFRKPVAFEALITTVQRLGELHRARRARAAAL
jgi:two-component system, NtrC family, nitrogen regulation response regulator NtrX